MFKKILLTAAYNFRTWRKNPKVVLTFLPTIVMCFLLTDKAVRFSLEHESVLQITEPFIWTFGDGNSILLASLLLLLLFSDMPFLSPATPFFLVRTDRKIWISGQLVYITLSTFLYMLFVLGISAFFCMNNAYIADIWSKTAAILGYSGDGKLIALPALVKTLEMSNPYKCTASIFLLMLLYTLVMVFIMMFFNLRKGHAAGIISAFVFSVTGFLLNPENLITVFKLPEELAYKARVFIGWVSPLNHATYHMHNFGYDKLPSISETFVLFLIILLILILICFNEIKKYSFNFRGTETK